MEAILCGHTLARETESQQERGKIQFTEFIRYRDLGVDILTRVRVYMCVCVCVLVCVCVCEGVGSV